MVRVLFLGPTDNFKRVESAFSEDVVKLISPDEPLNPNAGKNYDWIVSFGYKLKIPASIIKQFPRKAINVHISVLPWNRGMYPNLWSYLEGTPKGVTIHEIDEGIDTGPWIVRVTEELKGTTFRETWEKLMWIASALINTYWNDIKNGYMYSTPQENGGTLHYKKDLEKLPKEILPFGWDTKILDALAAYRKYLREKKDDTVR